MDENLQKLKECFYKLFGDAYLHDCFIEIDSSEDEVILAANREGMLLLIEELISLCEKNETYQHYHLDEAGMANKCNKPMIIQFVK